MKAPKKLPEQEQKLPGKQHDLKMQHVTMGTVVWVALLPCISPAKVQMWFLPIIRKMKMRKKQSAQWKNLTGNAYLLEEALSILNFAITQLKHVGHIRKIKYPR